MTSDALLTFTGSLKFLSFEGAEHLHELNSGSFHDAGTIYASGRFAEMGSPGHLKIRLCEDTLEQKSRMAFYAMLDCNLRLMENWRDLNQEVWGRQHDYETMMVLMAVVVTNGERIDFASIDEKLASLESDIPNSLLRRCTIASIAAATALNRETVRRKVKSLEEQAIVVRDEQRNVRFAPDVLNRLEMRKALSRQLHLFVRLTAKLAAMGIIERAD